MKNLTVMKSSNYRHLGAGVYEDKRTGQMMLEKGDPDLEKKSGFKDIGYIHDTD